jgi:circadian clock protein KaiC
MSATVTIDADGIRSDPPVLPKCPSGITGLDEITHGGLPLGRPTLVCGGAGCGKTLLAMEFLVRGIIDHDEPGVFLAFEERPEELASNVRSLGYDLDELTRDGKLVVDFVEIERSHIEEAGEYDLEGLFIRLGAAIDAVGARRVALDTIEVLFGGLSDHAILRSELRRLFHWLKDKGVTAVVTCERGQGGLSRHGLEEYVSDCVIVLDHRVSEQVSTRRLRVVKYRGSAHGADEYPFLIDEGGITVLPVTSLGLHHLASSERISTGVPRLDTMLGGDGVYRGTTVLVSGTAGSGKTSLAAHFANATCERGERCLYLAFEESPSQLVRNMRSVAVDLGRWVDDERLRIHASRPTAHGLEMHLAGIHKLVRDFQPQVVILDPITSLVHAGAASAASATLLRVVDFLKSEGITALFTSLTSGGDDLEQTEVGVSSLVDTWLLLRSIELNGERNRGLYVLKSRGMAHSNQIREFVLGEHGVELVDVYVGAGGVLTGSSRLVQAAREEAEQRSREWELERKRRDMTRKRRALEARIAALEAEFEAEFEEMERAVAQDQAVVLRLQQDRAEMARSRSADVGMARSGASDVAVQGNGSPE